MKRSLFIALFISFFTTLSFAQIQNASQVKDAMVNVSIKDPKDNILPNELVVFKSTKTLKEYQGISNDQGKFSFRLPGGDKYEIFVLGFSDSTNTNVLDIPALKPNTSYKTAFEVDIEFLPAKSFVLEDVNFETGKALLKEESFVALDELVAYLNRKDDDRIEIGGHTDNVGKAEKNLLLSQERAKSVMTYLISKGIDTARLVSKGYGMSKPIESNKTVEGRAQNRRTEVTIL